MLTATDRRIVRLAIPALGSLAVEPLYVLVDTAIVGRLGTAQLGGLALAASVLSLVVAGCNFLTYGTTERVARRLGAGDGDAAADVGVQAVWLSVLVGAVLGPLIAIGASLLGRVLGGEGDVLDFAVTYLRISAAGIPFVVFVLAAQGVLRGAADYRTPLVILFASNFLNTVLEVWFVFGLDLGVPGSAWSTVIAQVGAGAGLRVRDPPAARPGPGPPTELGRHGAAAQRRPAPAVARRVDARRLRRGDGDRRPGRRADPRRSPDRGEPVLPARPRPRRTGDPGADAGRRRARARYAGGGGRAVEAHRPSVGARRRRTRPGGRRRRPAAPPHLHRRRRRRQPGDGGVVVAGDPARSRGHRVRLRRRPHRRRGLPLPRPRRPRPTWSRSRRSGSRCSASTSGSPASGPGSRCGWSMRAVVNHRRAATLLQPAR